MKSKGIMGIMLMLLLIGMLTLPFNIQPLKSDWTWTETIYIRADGSVDPDTAPISTFDNITYTLTDNIVGDVPKRSSAIVVEMNNIVVDGAGYTFQGTGAYDFQVGLNLTERNNVTIRNMKIRAFGYSIRLYRSSNNVISGNNITNNIFSIWLEMSSNNCICGNNIADNRYGIRLDESSNNSILGNKITNTDGYPGIWLDESSNNSILGNIITANDWDGIELFESPYNSILGNNISNNGNGISLLSSSYNTLRDNSMADNKANFGVFGWSLSNYLNDIDSSNTVDDNPIYYLVNQKDLVINPATHPRVGYLAFINCANVTAEGLNLTNNGEGLLLAYTTNSRITRNNITNNTEGIWLYRSSNNVISGNNITNNRADGIELYRRSEYNILSGNNITNNGDGIELSYSSYNTLRDNSMADNKANFGVVGGDFPDYLNDVDSSNTVDCKPVHYWVNKRDMTVPLDAGYVALVNCTRITVKNLNLTNNKQGVQLTHTTNSRIIKNNITNNEHGISLYESSNNSILGNTITANDWTGINFWPDSLNNIVFGNNITATRHYGVDIFFSSGNSIYHNNFANNAYAHVRIQTDDENFWDSSGEGNYWSDYEERYPNATELDGSGIWDTPYVIDENNQDNYPLMKPTTPTDHPIHPLNFNITYNEHFYNVTLRVPASTYNAIVQSIGSSVYTWYPNIDRSTLEQAYYVWHHVESPNIFPILNTSCLESGQPISDKELKTQIIDGLLKYCFELFTATWPAKLDSYQSFGEEWLQAHEDLTNTVRLSDLLSGVTNLLTIIGPIIGTIENIYGTSTSQQVKETVSLVFKVIRGFEALVEEYGTEKANAIRNILVSFAIISSEDYDSLELYKKLKEDPSRAIQVLEEINSQVLEANLNSDARSIIYDFLVEIEEGSVGEFAAGTALGLYAYFASGLTAFTALQIGASAVLESFVGYVIPLALASAISEGYIMPMAKALHAAWEDMKYTSDIYFDMHGAGLRIANPEDNTLNFTNSELFASLYGVLCLVEYHYYMNAYFYRSHQLFVPQSELDSLKSSAELAFSHTQEWMNTLQNIHDYAEAIVYSTDPEGLTFNFTLTPVINTLPAMPENSSGFVLIVNSTSNLSMQCGDSIFTVQNRTWFSNFTYSFYVDDSYGSSFLMIFNPPEQQYAVETENKTLMILKNFEPYNGNFTLSNAGELTSTDLYFNVSDSSVDPYSVIPEFPSFLILPLFMIATLLALIVYRRKRTTNS